MEWVALVLGAVVAVLLVAWIVRRGSGARSAHSPQHTHVGSQTSHGVEDSMSMRLPTGGIGG